MKTTTSITYPVFALFALACFGLSPQAQAVCQEGCSGNNTFLGEDALLNNAGFTNTAVGVDALLSNTTGNGNTAIGSDALEIASGSSNIAVGFEAGVKLTTGSNN